MFLRTLGTTLVCFMLIIQAYLVAARFDESGHGYKTYEIPHRSIQFHLCGDQIYYLFMHLCFSHDGNRVTRDLHEGVLQEKTNALRFFKTKRRLKRRATDIVEECCIEGCVVEEVQEYCPY